jgi:hypothetical protein
MNTKNGRADHMPDALRKQRNVAGISRVNPPGACHWFSAGRIKCNVAICESSSSLAATGLALLPSMPKV